MGAVQHHAFFSIQNDNTVLIEVLRKNNSLCHSRHLNKKIDVFEHYFPISSPSATNDLAMTCREYMNGLKI